MRGTGWHEIGGKHFCEAQQDWAAAFAATYYRCSGCRAFKPAVRSRIPDAQLKYRPNSAAISFLANGIGIMRADFADLFEPDFGRNFAIGRLFNRRGEQIAGFLTFVPHRPIELRNSEPVHRTCEQCGRFVYQGLGPEENWFIHSASLTDQRIYGGDFGLLFLHEDLAARIERKKWRGIYYRRIQVLDKPLDGIDPFPEHYY